MATPERRVKTGETAVADAPVWNETTREWDAAPTQDQYYCQWGPTRTMQEVWYVDPIDGYIFPEGEGAKIDGVWYHQKNAVDLVMVKTGASMKVSEGALPTFSSGSWSDDSA